MQFSPWGAQRGSPGPAPLRPRSFSPCCGDTSAASRSSVRPRDGSVGALRAAPRGRGEVRPNGIGPLPAGEGPDPCSGEPRFLLRAAGQHGMVMPVPTGSTPKRGLPRVMATGRNPSGRFRPIPFRVRSSALGRDGDGYRGAARFGVRCRLLRGATVREGGHRGQRPRCRVFRHEARAPEDGVVATPPAHPRSGAHSSCPFDREQE